MLCRHNNCNRELQYTTKLAPGTPRSSLGGQLLPVGISFWAGFGQAPLGLLSWASHVHQGLPPGSEIEGEHLPKAPTCSRLPLCRW